MDHGVGSAHYTEVLADRFHPDPGAGSLVNLPKTPNQLAAAAVFLESVPVPLALNLVRLEKTADPGTRETSMCRE